MARCRSAVAVGLLVVLAIPGGPTFAASPEAAGQSMQITGAASGYAPRSEVVVRPGWVIDTFQSAKTTVRVFGQAGSSVSFSESSTPGKTGSASFSMASPPTSAVDKDSAQQGGEASSAVAAVIALGMDPKTALEQFGGLDTLDGSTPASDVALATGTRQDAPNVNVDTPVVLQGSTILATNASTRETPRVPVPESVTVSKTTPWDTQCASVSAQNNLVQGYGCSTLYVVWASGSDWYLANKYKFSAQSVSKSLFPLRLKEVGWRLTFPVNNVLFDWDPVATQALPGCSTVTIGSQGDPTHGGFNISISAQICPNSIGPWGPLGGLQSGAVWDGNEVDNAFEAAIGTQEMHNPANASSSHTSTYTVTWNCGLDC